MKEIQITAKSVDKAVTEGLIELGLTRDQVEIEVITKPSLFKSAVVKISAIAPSAENASAASCEAVAPIAEAVAAPINDNCDAVEPNKTGNEEYSEEDTRVINFVKSLLAAMDLNCELKIKANHEKLSILIFGADTNTAIGYRGEALDAIQYITLLAANRPSRYSKKLAIDAEGYRERRAETLTALSTKLAAQAIKSGRAIELEPMNPFERRVIHTALQGNKDVTTLSEGDEPNRFVVICPVQADNYDNASKNNFKKSGFGKTRSFGQKRNRF